MTTFRVLYPSLVTISEEDTKCLDWIMSTKESYKTGKIFEE